MAWRFVPPPEINTASLSFFVFSLTLSHLTLSSTPLSHQEQDSKDGTVVGSFFRELLTIKLLAGRDACPAYVRYWMLDT
jgi:hypothetical protein